MADHEFPFTLASHRLRISRRSALLGLGGSGLAAASLAGITTRGGRAAEWDATPIPAGTDAPSSSLKFRLEASTPKQFPGGTLRKATSVQMPALSGMALITATIEPGYLRELHWHANASELNVCLQGQGTLAIFAPDGTNEVIELRPGTVTFIPAGYTHGIHNTGTDRMHLVLGFSHENPDTFDLSASLPPIPGAYLAQSFGVDPATFPYLAPAGDRVYVPLPAGTALTPPNIPATSTGAFSTTFDQIDPEIYAGGSVRPVHVENIPRLTALTVFDLIADPHALREPHWHTNASELNYCVRGTAELTIVFPDGTNQRFVVEPGDVAFIPTSWFHYIANLSAEPLEFLVFFSNPKPDHIDLTQTIAAFPPQYLAASFGLDPQAFASLPDTGDVFIAK